MAVAVPAFPPAKAGTAGYEASMAEYTVPQFITISQCVENRTISHNRLFSAGVIYQPINLSIWPTISQNVIGVHVHSAEMDAMA